MERERAEGLAPVASISPEVAALRATLSEQPSADDDVPSEAVGLPPGEWDWAALHTQIRSRFLSLAQAKYRFSREEAEDILQTVYLRVLSRDPRVKDPVGYLKIAFLNTCINTAIARERGRADLESVDLPDPAAEKTIARLDAVRMINKAIKSAAPRCKKIIRLYFGQEYSLNEMCGATGYSQKTVWKRIWGCVKRMRECLAA